VIQLTQKLPLQILTLKQCVTNSGEHRFISSSLAQILSCPTSNELPTAATGPNLNEVQLISRPHA
jgi:hypothetical protein